MRQGTLDHCHLLRVPHEIENYYQVSLQLLILRATETQFLFPFLKGLHFLPLTIIVLSLDSLYSPQALLHSSIPPLVTLLHKQQRNVLDGIRHAGV